MSGDIDNFRCDDCGKEFKDETTLRMHRQSIHEGHNARYICGACNKGEPAACYNCLRSYMSNVFQLRMILEETCPEQTCIGCCCSVHAAPRSEASPGQYPPRLPLQVRRLRTRVQDAAHVAQPRGPPRQGAHAHTTHTHTHTHTHNTQHITSHPAYTTRTSQCESTHRRGDASDADAFALN